MLYGFGNKGGIIVVAADSLNEFENAKATLDDLRVEYTVPGIMTMVDDAVFKGLELPPLILTKGDVTSKTLTILDRDDSLSRHSHMMETSLDSDSTSELYSLFEAQQEDNHVEIAETWDLSDSDLFLDGDRSVIFTTYRDAYSGTVAIVTSPAALSRYKMPLHGHFEAGARIHNLVDMPTGFTSEIATGCFVYDGSPLAARAALLRQGYAEDRVLSRMVQKAFHGRPDASTADETAFALNLVQPVTGPDFIFAIAPHPDKPSTFVAITTQAQWKAERTLPISIYLTPLITMLLPQGYGESQPGVFEVLRDSSVVREQLVRAGMNEHTALREVLTDVLNGIAISSPVTPIAQAAIDWDNLPTQWAGMDEAARRLLLPNNQISFSVLETSTSSCFVFFCPTMYFAKHNNIMGFDLDLMSRIVSSAERVGDNVFKVIGPDPIQVAGMLTGDGFIDDYALTLFVTMALYSGDLGQEIGFDPLA
jgi:hypothetical protein